MAPHPRSTMVAAHFFCSSVPLLNSTSAKAGPAWYMCAAGCAPRISSPMAHTTERGTGTPPTSSLSPMRYHSASHRALNDFLKDSGSATVCVSGSKTGVAVRVGERFAKRSLGQACDLCQHVADSVGIQVAPSAFAQWLLQSENLEEVELQVPSVALVMAHVFCFSQ